MVFEHFRFGKILMALGFGVASSPELMETILENLLKYNVFDQNVGNYRQLFRVI